MMMFLQLTLLTLFIASPGSLIHAKNVITCGGNVQRLVCARGVIKVQSTFYGRSSSAICRANHHPFQLTNIWCRSTIGAIPARCNGRRVCEFNSNIVGRFDPCPGTSKYFSTTYTCIRKRHRKHRCRGAFGFRCKRFHRRVTICDNSYKTLSCGRNTIKIHKASYGRSNRITCSRGVRHWSTQNTRCYANTRSKVASMCDGRTACTLFSSRAYFPDYCPATTKYLKVSYNCVVRKEVVACEHSNAVLTCGRHRTIRVLHANYGRTDKRTCRRRRIFFFWFYNTHCYQRDSTARVVNRCNGSRTCVVPATNQFFSDPCFGTYKYLKVSYACV